MVLKDHKPVKISDRKFQRFGDIVTPISSSNAKDKLQKIHSRLIYYLIPYPVSRKQSCLN